MFLKTTKFNKIKSGTLSMVGCTTIELKEYLENQFVDGMSWDNHGLYGWHIDHIIPMSSATNEEDLYKLCHYTNNLYGQQIILKKAQRSFDIFT